MANVSTNGASAFTPIVAKLETQIALLDAMGAHVAAAHIDAAIHQLRVDGLKAREAARR